MTTTKTITSLSYRDAAVRAIEEQEEFFRTLDKVVTDTTFIETSSKNLRVLGLADGPLLVAENRKNSKVNDDVADEAILETAGESGSKLSVLYRTETEPEKGILLSPAASTSLINKLGCACPAFTKLSLCKKEEWVSDAISACPKKDLTLIERNGKVRGVASNRYNVVPQNRVLEIVKDYLVNNFDEAEFTIGVITHEYTFAKWELQDEDLLKRYKTFLASNGFAALEDAVIEVSADTSDTTDSACKISISIVDAKNGFEMLLGSPVTMAHLKSASEESWSKAIAGIGNHIDDLTNQLTRLGSIRVMNPLHCYSNIAKMVGFSDRQISDTLDRAEELLEYTDEHTAHDIYYMVFAALSDMKKDIAPSSYVKMYENAARCLHPAFDWPAFDCKKI